VSVDELCWLSNKLVAVTHGRGMFVTTPIIGPVNFTAISNSISGGNGNGTVDPNECNTVNLVIQNLGGATATNVNAILSSTTPGVDIVQAYSAYPNVTSAAFATNATAFQITTTPSFVCGTPVVVTLNLTYNNTNSSVSFTLPSGAGGYTITQTTGVAIVPGTIDIGNHGDETN